MLGVAQFSCTRRRFGLSSRGAIVGVDMLRALVLGVAVLLSAAPAWAWRIRLARSRDVHPIVLDRTGAVFAGLDVPPLGHAGGTAAALVKVDAAGKVRWRRRFRGHGRERLDFLYALQTTADGDILTAGSLNDDGRSTFFVTRLAGRNGALRWQANVHGQQQRDGDEAVALALAPDGDLVVAGGLAGASSPPNHFAIDFAVVKLSANSGEERWRFVLDGSAEDFDEASAVSVDAAGNVVAVGTLTEGLPTESLNAQTVTVIKLAPDDGHLLWRHDDIEAAPYPRDVVLDGAGDIFIPTAAHDATGGRFAVMKLSGATGQPLWTAGVGTSTPRYQTAVKAVLVPSGGVAAVGITADEAGIPALTAVLLDAETGAERWRRFLRGNDGYGVGEDLEVMPDGDVVVGGQLRNRRSCYDLSFAQLAAATGEVRELRSLDGTTTVPVCDADCLHGMCTTPPRAGLDRDSLSSLAVDDEGRIVVAGVVSDGYYGRLRGLVAAISPRGR